MVEIRLYLKYNLFLAFEARFDIMAVYEETRQDASAKTRSCGRVTYFLASYPRAFSSRNGGVFPGTSF